MKEYEYKEEIFTTGQDKSGLIDYLNNEGSDGWEAIKIDKEYDDVTLAWTFTIYFKKEKPEF